ncbi:hypothetical protein RSOLAG1IB_10111 [Rhizoctonia solani AG-1 IB]|uniref:Uncharacterized protein n=1 Tax=Thanatephorus cucumeris (strain AG1-IB / isolate 7/3/14) TaxID=1108050 RepID=A0A0B7FZ64_THACB|nr:hypothetical protein RSOLAG1IB_10111 [Rhizoctonia solani AG-1 IB]
MIHTYYYFISFSTSPRVGGYCGGVRPISTLRPFHCNFLVHLFMHLGDVLLWRISRCCRTARCSWHSVPRRFLSHTITTCIVFCWA